MKDPAKRNFFILGKATHYVTELTVIKFRSDTFSINNFLTVFGV